MLRRKDKTPRHNSTIGRTGYLTRGGRPRDRNNSVESPIPPERNSHNAAGTGTAASAAANVTVMIVPDTGSVAGNVGLPATPANGP